MTNEQLTTKESIRLGQAMNIVGNKYANHSKDNKFYEWNNEDFKLEVMSLYDTLADIEQDVIDEKKEEELASKKPMAFPNKATATPSTASVLR